METKLSILVVDDTPENIDTVVGILNKQYKIRVAVHGVEALEMASSKKPDIILLDIMMPGMDGYEVCQKLKENPETKQIPIIFLTAKTEAEDVVRGLKLGASDYVTKPFHPQELLARIENVADLARNQRKVNRSLKEQAEQPEESSQAMEMEKATANIQTYMSQFQLDFPSKTQLLEDILNYLQSSYAPVCEKHNIDMIRMAICLCESLNNAVIHGNLEVPSSLKQENWDDFDNLVKEREANPTFYERNVSLRYQINERQIEIEIEDQGSGFDPSQLPDPNDPEAFLSSGRGILLIRSFMDHVSWNDTGNKITMIKKFEMN